MRKTKLKPRSAKKAADTLLYRAEIEARGGIPYGYSPHHILGREGKKILCFAIIQNFLHDRIHANGKWAREEGWLCRRSDDSLPLAVPHPVHLALERWKELTGGEVKRRD